MKQKAFCHLVELAEEKAKVARKKKGLCCRLCSGSLKKDVEVWVDYLEGMCKKYIVGRYVCKEVWKCHDVLPVEEEEIESDFKWKCEE
eukprot:1478740-Ditylum_brightwellii.AAC.1